MTTPELGKSESVSVRKVWPLEADFTTWLAENIDLLSQAVGIDLELLQEEAWLTGWPEWTGRVDVLAKTVEGDGYVVIENQMEESDNDHFAGLLNYGSHSDAKTLILVAGKITDWHRRTMDWLNDAGGIRIYGVEMSARCNGIQVERRLDLVSGPTRRKEWPGFEFPADKQKHINFFRPLVAELWQCGIAHRNVARPDNDQTFPSGFAGITYNVGFWNSAGPSIDVYLWIARPDKDDNKRIFDALHSRFQREIERELGFAIGWYRRDIQRMCSIGTIMSGHVNEDEGRLGEMRVWAFETVVRLREVIQPRLENVMAELLLDDAEAKE